MDENIVLNVTELFQLAALGPCLFLLLFLIGSARKFRQVVIPFIYFISLTCSFLLPILVLFPELDSFALTNTLIFNEHTAPQISFLFILQLILRRPPPLIYWSIMALPFIGGGYFLYLSLHQESICLLDDSCLPAEKIMILYRVISSAVVFMLLLPIMRRTPTIDSRDPNRAHKYWLIVMLIVYNLLVMVNDLCYIADNTNAAEALFIKTMISVSFVYLVTTSVFRVFHQTLELRTLEVRRLTLQDKVLGEQIEHYIHDQKPYRILGFNRTKMADHFAVTEQHLSKVINLHFNKSFSDLMNEYRITEAKFHLKETDTPITTISFDVGFSSITSFNRVFKQATGVSPKAFRESGKVV